MRPFMRSNAVTAAHSLYTGLKSANTASATLDKEENCSEGVKTVTYLTEDWVQTRINMYDSSCITQQVISVTDDFYVIIFRCFYQVYLKIRVNITSCYDQVCSVFATVVFLHLCSCSRENN